MREYTLRDKELLKKLEGIWPNFEEKLRAASLHGDYYKGVRVDTGDGDTWVTFDWDALELSKAYDPNGWNIYPEVTPPTGAVMLIEYQTEVGLQYGETAFFGEDGAWYLTDTQKSDPPHDFHDGARVLRFRSWY